MFSKQSQSLKVLMMLTVSMTVSHLCQNLEIVKGVRSFKWASEGVNYCNKRAKSLCGRPLPWCGGGDHLCRYGRKLIGSLVPAHSRSVRSNKYAFLDPSLNLSLSSSTISLASLFIYDCSDRRGLLWPNYGAHWWKLGGWIL